MSVAVTYASTVTLNETPASGVPAIAANQVIKQDQFNTTKSLNATSTPNVKKDVAQEFTLTTGAATIDLTALTGAGGGAVSMTGSKGRFFKFKAPSGNGAAIVLSKGASNGFTGLGAAFSVSIPPGGEFTYYDGGNGGTVGSGSKTLDMAGSGSSDKLQVVVVGGD